MMIVIQLFNVILSFYFVVMMKNNVNIFGNVQWNIISSFEQHQQRKLNKARDPILHVLDQDFDSGKWKIVHFESKLQRRFVFVLNAN